MTQPGFELLRIAPTQPAFPGFVLVVASGSKIIMYARVLLPAWQAITKWPS
jgi:hypothetical protein